LIVSAANCLPWSVIKYFGAAPAFRITRPRNMLMAFEVWFHEAIVAGVTRNLRAVWDKGQPRAARSSRIAMRSIGG
jgi:hypothetical protein